MDTGSLVLFLKQHGVQFVIKEFDRDVSHVSDLPEVGMNPADDIKSLVVLDHAGEALIVIIPGPNRLDLGKLAAILGLQSCKLAPALDAEKYTGYPVGAVPPLGHKTALRTVVDPRVLERKKVIAGGGTKFSLIELDPREIVRAGNAVVADITT